MDEFIDLTFTNEVTQLDAINRRDYDLLNEGCGERSYDPSKLGMCKWCGEEMYHASETSMCAHCLRR